MNWFIAALFGAVLMATTWLGLKHIQNTRVSHERSLIVYFFVMSLAVIAWHLAQGISIGIEMWSVIAILLVGAAFSCATNLLVLHSFARSKNPGLSLALVATQVIWLTLGGVLFFDAGVGLLAGIGVILVLTGVTTLHVRSFKIDLRWSGFALLAGFLNGIAWTIIRGAQDLLPGLRPETLMLYIFAPQILMLMLVRECKSRKKQEKGLNWKLVGILGGTGLVGTAANMFIFRSVTSAPNPGYALAVTTSQVIITLFASRFLFGSPIGWKQFFATLLIIAGVVAVRLGSG